MSESFLIEDPIRVTVGTVGPVGQRLFVLQARDASEIVTVKVEKIQVASLATYLGRMLRQLARPHELPAGEALDLEPFDEPDFAAQSLALSYDEVGDRVVLMVEELNRSEMSAPDPAEEVLEEALVPDGSSARLVMTREQAAALAIRATELVEAGRPPCPLCGYPLDPRGHACPRTNGHGAPLT